MNEDDEIYCEGCDGNYVNCKWFGNSIKVCDACTDKYATGGLLREKCPNHPTRNLWHGFSK